MNALLYPAAASSRLPGPPPQLMPTTIELRTISDTAALGATIAAQLRRGDLVLLRGDLGAGKTELARAIIRAAAGAAIEVPSPTFTLVQPYETPGLLITHADLYRLRAVEELGELGLNEALDTGALLVEWPDRAEGRWPPDRLEIELLIDCAGPGRRAHMTAQGDWAARLGAQDMERR